MWMDIKNDDADMTQQTQMKCFCAQVGSISCWIFVLGIRISNDSLSRIEPVFSLNEKYDSI